MKINDVNTLFKTGKPIKVKVDKTITDEPRKMNGTVINIEETERGFYVFVSVDKYGIKVPPIVIKVKNGADFPLEISNRCYLFENYLKNNKKDESYVEFLEAIILEIRNSPRF